MSHNYWPVWHVCLGSSLLKWPSKGSSEVCNALLGAGEGAALSAQGILHASLCLALLKLRTGKKKCQECGTCCTQLLNWLRSCQMALQFCPPAPQRQVLPRWDTRRKRSGKSLGNGSPREVGTGAISDAWGKIWVWVRRTKPTWGQPAPSGSGHHATAGQLQDWAGTRED